MDMYYVCTGCTWYSSLVPIFLHNEGEDELYEEERENIVGEYSLSFDEFLENLKLSKKEFEFIKKISEEYISFDTSDVGSASKILNEIRKNRKHCILFHLFLDNFLSAFHSRSLYGKEWIVALDDGFIVAPESNKCLKTTSSLISKDKFKIISNEDYVSVKKSLYIPKAKINFEFVLEKI
jgi:predicted nucleotidyltransferase